MVLVVETWIVWSLLRKDRWKGERGRCPGQGVTLGLKIGAKVFAFMVHELVVSACAKRLCSVGWEEVKGFAMLWDHA